MKTTIQEQDGKMVAFFEGRLDTVAAPEAAVACEPLFECRNKDIIIDCTKLEFISSSGLRVLIDVLKFTKPRGCQVFLRGVSDDIHEVLEMTGFIKFFEYL